MSYLPLIHPKKEKNLFFKNIVILLNQIKLKIPSKVYIHKYRHPNEIIKLYLNHLQEYIWIGSYSRTSAKCVGRVVFVVITFFLGIKLGKRLIFDYSWGGGVNKADRLDFKKEF